MRVQLPNGKFAKKSSSVYRFVKRTGKTVENYFEWAKSCGQKASHSYKDKMICEKIGVESISKIECMELVEDQVYMPLESMNNYILENTKNPADIASCWLELIDQEDSSIDGYLNENLRPTIKESFERWCDKNHFDSVSKSWFSKDGLPLDVQAMQLSEGYGREINEQDIVGYLITYRKGKYKSYLNILAEQYEKRFEELFEFKLSRAYAKHLMNEIFGSEVEAESKISNLSF